MKAVLRKSSLLALAIILCAVLPMRAELFYAVSGGLFLNQFNSTTPGTLSPNLPITGLQTSETILGLDLRPANGHLYGLGSTSRLYDINPLTGAATQVGSAGAFTLNGTSFGMDFNPTVDRIRVVSNNEQNMRLNPNDGTLTGLDTNLSPAGNVVAAAYTNNFVGASVTTLYGIDSASGNLVLIGGINASPSPNGGIVSVVGSLGLGTNLSSLISFDISGLTGIAYATVVNSISTRLDGLPPISNLLYTINLTTGAATLVGQIGPNTTLAITGLTAATAVPEPSSVLLFGGAALAALYCRYRRVAK